MINICVISNKYDTFCEHVIFKNLILNILI